MLSAELNHHLVSERAAGEEPGNYRNGTSAKTVLTLSGPPPLVLGHQHRGKARVQVARKLQRQRPAFDDHVIGTYARGMTMREIRGH